MKKLVSKHLSNWKNGSWGLDEYINFQGDYQAQDMKQIGSYMENYQEKLKKNNALDFDDLIVKTIELFKKYPEILEKYASRFEYLLVDEFQDTNAVQYEIVKMLSSIHGNIFVVGDEDQSIYSWRGANFQNIFNFRKDFSDVKVFKLERNYRSTEEIVKIANNVIKNNKQRMNKHMWTEKKGGEIPTLLQAYDEKEEALFVARTISKLIAQGYKYSDFAVLMRVNALSRNFEEAFLSYNIPHKIYGGFRFYERVEIKNLIAYLRLFVNPADDVSFARIINFPKRGIGDGTLAKIQELDFTKSLLENTLSDKIKENNALFKKIEDFANQYNSCKNHQADGLLNFVKEVIDCFKIKSAYSVKDEDDISRLMNIDQFVASVKEYEELNPHASLGEFLETITLSSDIDEMGEDGSVVIASVHAVKGLEFKVVFVVGLEEGIFPISRALDSDFELEEERRLMYVALTRAEEKLYLLGASRRFLYGRTQGQIPSRFVKEFEMVSLAPKLNNYQKNEDFSQKIMKFERKNANYEHNSNNFPFNHNDFVKQKKKEERKDFSIFKVGQRVEHPRYGEGEIVEISSDGLVGDIIFDDFGRKSLMLDLAPLTIID